MLILIEDAVDYDQEIKEKYRLKDEVSCLAIERFRNIGTTYDKYIFDSNGNPMSSDDAGFAKYIPLTNARVLAEQYVLAMAKIKDLEKELRWLDALEAAGVDNWSGYDYARELLSEDNKEDK